MIGYKVMKYENNKLIAGADSRLEYDLIKDGKIEMPGNGCYIGMDKEYVIDYYSGLAENEVLLTLEFDVKDIITGDINDKEPEISLKTLKIKEAELYQDGEFVKNMDIKQKTSSKNKNRTKLRF